MKAIIPAAGIGSRMGDLTRDLPKGLLDVGGQPLIHNSLEGAVEFGVTEIIVVTPPDGSFFADAIGQRYRGLPVRYAVQHRRAGLVDAMLAAQPHLGEDDFALLLPDEILIRPRRERSLALRRFGGRGDYRRLRSGRTGKDRPQL